MIVDFYGEALCPDCAAFVLNILAPLLDEESSLQDIMLVNYVGWGNAKNTSAGVECQHGPQVSSKTSALTRAFFLHALIAVKDNAVIVHSPVWYMDVR